MKKKTYKTKNIGKDLSREQQKEERKNRRYKIVSVISQLTPYLIGILWLVESVIGLIDRTGDWILIGIIGSIWILIGIVNSK